ncbi:unnamed protein product [Closterium sp. Naga37s-1]|nr:unnamed protein product [Closterium sp. Naga37s-1]
MGALGRPHAVPRPAPALSPARPPRFRPCCHRPRASPILRHSPSLPALSASPRRSPPGAAIGAIQRGNGAAQGRVGLRSGEAARAERQSERVVDYNDGIRNRRMRRKGGRSQRDGDERTGQMATDSVVQRGDNAVQTPLYSQQPVQPPSEPTASGSSTPSPSLAHRLLSRRRAAQVQGEGRGKGAAGVGSRTSGEGSSSVGEADRGTGEPPQSQRPAVLPSPSQSPSLLTSAPGGAAALNRRLVEATCLADVMRVVANEMARLPPRPEWHVGGAGATARGAGVGDGVGPNSSWGSGKVRGNGKGGRRSREEEEAEEEEMEKERREMERRWEEAAACSLFSPINAVTALHRIARHMQAEGMPPPSRLALARTPPLRLLVAAALPAVRAARCNAQTLSNLVWALARIGGAGGGAGDMVAGRGAEVGAGGRRGGGQRTWVYSEELDAVAAAVLPIQHTLAPQHIANIAAAFALARHLPPPALLPTLARQACFALPPLSPSFPTTPAHPSGRAVLSPHELSQLLWAFACLHHALPPALSRALNRAAATFSPSSLPHTSQPPPNQLHMTAFSPPPPCPLACLRAWSPQHVANSVWALAVLQHTHGALFHALWGEVLRRQRQFCGEEQEGEVEGEGSEGEQRARVGERHLSQLFQVAVTLRAEGAGGAVERGRKGQGEEGEQACGGGSGGVRRGQEVGDGGAGRGEGRDEEGADWVWEEGARVWRAEAAREKVKPCSHWEVEQALSALGLVAWRGDEWEGGGGEREQGDEGKEGEDGSEGGEGCSDGMGWVSEYTSSCVWHYSIDIALPGRRIALEVDGPSHFTRNTRARCLPHLLPLLHPPACRFHCRALNLPLLRFARCLPSFPCHPYSALRTNPTSTCCGSDSTGSNGAQEATSGGGWMDRHLHPLLPSLHSSGSLPCLSAVLCAAVEPSGR